VGSSEKRTRGPNKKAPWRRRPEDGVSILRLALDTSDPVERQRLEALFRGGYQVKRALQRDARDRVDAYWAAHRERARDPAATRERLGLSRKALEYRAYEHIQAAPHLRRSVTKAQAMHLADSVWSGVERHLFRDARGQRHGRPHIGRWYDFTRMLGRARSHEKERKWETARLHGSLAGHRRAYTGPDGDFIQPHRMRPVHATSWWAYDGPLAVVYTGLGDGTLVLPVRLPTAPSNQAMLDHHLADPSKWHKIDLVRRRDPNATGGWRYEAHLFVITEPYVSPTVAARRAKAALATADRTVGIDVNVSNITVASQAPDDAIRVTRIERDATQKQRDRGRARRERRRQRELERSRRAMNRAQYRLSRRQEKRARRREAAALPPVDIDTVPMGPRVARADGKPIQGYRRDRLSASYQRTRAAQAADAATATQARRDRARQTAADVVAQHGYQLVVEDCSVAAWSRLWGAAVAAFSPGVLIAAIDREAKAVAKLAGGEGGLRRAATRQTALSQHCPCGARVDKRLADRVHTCATCGLRGDRDAVAAILASFVLFERRDEPTSARVNYDASARALPEIRRALQTTYSGWQDTLTESTDLSAREGSCLTWQTSTPDFVGWLGESLARRPTQPWMSLAPTRPRQSGQGREPARPANLRDVS
jgi:hypothetical protein